MTLGPYLLAFLLFALSGAAVGGRGDVAAAAPACTVTAPTSAPDDVPVGAEVPLVGAETSPEAPWGVDDGADALDPHARVDARRLAAVASPPAAERDGPLLPPPEG